MSLAHIGSYQIESTLGRSSLSVVHKAQDSRDGRLVALRCFANSLSGRTAFAETFARFARGACKLQDPRLVQARDWGESDGQHFLASDYCAAGGLGGLLRRHGQVLELGHALSLIRQVAEGLLAIDAARWCHGDIRPSNILLDDEGRALLADAGLSGLLRDTVDRQTVIGDPAYQAPELLHDRDASDIRCDIYSLGATFYRMLSGQPLFSNDDPLELSHQVQRAPLPSFAETLPQIPAEVREFITRCCWRAPDKRYGSPLAVVEVLKDLEEACGKGLRAGEAIDHLDAMASEREALRKQIDPAQLTRLTKMIRVRPDGLLATMRMAPGASFQRPILELILSEADIRHGLERAALSEASRPQESLRQLVIARGDPPSPGAAGRDVHGDPLPPLPRSVQIRVSPDGYQARALLKPGRKVDHEELDHELQEAGLAFGVDEQVIAGLRSGPASNQPSVLIAQGRPAVAPVDAGWRMSEQLKAIDGPPLVRRGDVLGRWQAAKAGTAGLDVYAEERPVDPPRDAMPEELAGTGTTIRGQGPATQLLAERDGMLLRRAGGVWAVAEVLDIEGDVDAQSAPVESESVVVVRGNLRAGGVIKGASDVVVMGDVEGGELSAGGDIEVAGCISGDGPPLSSGGEIRAEEVDGRQLIAGSLRVSGALRCARIHVTGDVQAQYIVGGEVVCAGSISAEVLGDEEGTSTILRCGSHLELAKQQDLARLRWQQIAASRREVVEQRQVMEAERIALQTRSVRHRSADVSCAKALSMMHKEVERLDARLGAIDGQAETLRDEVRQRFSERRKLVDVAEASKIRATRAAHQGVSASIADGGAEQLTRTRRRYELALKPDIVQ